MPDLVRLEVFKACQTVIVKIGTNVLTTDNDRLDLDRIQCISDQIFRIQETGRKVVLVSSGAVGAGIGILGLNRRPDSLPALQATAAIGQPQLMRTWNDALLKNGLKTAQLLLTGNDFRNRQRYLNVRNTLRTLFDFGVVPIVNENDTVSIKEIAVGDNDQLASMLATLLPDPLLVILSGIAGLYNGPPSDPASVVISLIEKPDDSLLKLAAAEQSTRGRGGMASKLRAILAATGMGETVILASGRSDTVLDDIREGKTTGTLFLAKGEAVASWKRWIGFGAPPAGVLVIDDGATKAVRESGRSLLAVGVTEVQGEFESGALVGLKSQDGTEIARGLANYSSDEIRRIQGRRSDQIAAALGHVPFGEVIHRDNLALIGN
ncbi:MAG: glutamate 5-kinase [Planctomycetota bacterium]|jgi:glutamate 5-kinase|nr:glutamate 5-kinase [Planctomycetales bacterium]RLT07209.1 MAG: glutamate 5-kinase [Planctomycetota bacterium]